MGVDRSASGGSGGVLSPVDRRRFLKGAGLLGAGVLLPGLRGTTAWAAKEKQGQSSKNAVVYRLSSRGTHACKACKNHDFNYYFRTWSAANGTRAHRGCDCRIVTQSIPRPVYNCYFSKNRDAFDRRKDHGHCAKLEEKHGGKKTTPSPTPSASPKPTSSPTSSPGPTQKLLNGLPKKI